MNVLLLVATERGRQFAAKMFTLMPEARFIVCSFPETPHEPRYLDAIRELTESHGHRFIQTHDVAQMPECDLLFAVSWRYMVPKAFYERAKLGAYVFHDSILPRYRGFSPTVWAMMAGDQWLGASLIKMAEGVDEGDIVDRHGVQVGRDDYIGDVMPRITEAYLSMIERSLPQILSGTIESLPQTQIGYPTYCAKWTPADARINWTKPAETVRNLIRATSTPYPGAFCFLPDGSRLTVLRADVGERYFEAGVPGRVVGLNPLEVLCGDGHTLVISESSTGFKLSDTLT